MAEPKVLRRFQAGVERALALFDSTNEWADYIAFLSRLLKALQEPPPEADVPFKTTIARHLAQCLKPSLPSGVHQKALDVYQSIFSMIGTEGLSRDLALYLPGLSHTFAFASLATRPYVLSLYDDYILELHVNTLRPALRALLLSLLPGIEEETSEDFGKTLDTFDRLRRKFSETNHEEIFWQNLFLASITSTHRRAGVLVYLTRYLPKLGPKHPSDSVAVHGELPPSSTIVTTPEPGLLVRCFATGLQDDQALIQRGFLDLLVTHLPLNADIFSEQSHMKDLDVLVSSAIAVVLKRDMSLNRRLWSWFTGTDSKAQNTSSETTDQGLKSVSAVTNGTKDRNTRYFSQHGLQSLVRSLNATLSESLDDPIVQSRPFKVALSLMDRWDIGGPVVEAVFVPLIQRLKAYQSNAPSQLAFDEVFRSANVFFDGIEARLIAKQMIELLQHDDFDLVLFIIGNINLEDDEMMTCHIPMVCLFVVDKLQKELVGPPSNDNSGIECSSSLKLSRILQELLDLVAVDVLNDVEVYNDRGTATSWISDITQFYDRVDQEVESTTLPISYSMMTSILIGKLERIFLSCLSIPKADLELLSRLTSCLEHYFSITKGSSTLRETGFVSTLIDRARDPSPELSARFTYSVSVSKVLASIRHNTTTQNALSMEVLYDVVPTLIYQLWTLLHPSSPQYHVEAVENIWRLHALTSNLEVAQSAILSLLTNTSSDNESTGQAVLRFSALWTHSKPASKSFFGLQAPVHPQREDDVLDLLKPSLIFLLDNLDVTSLDNPTLHWFRSLGSINPILTVILSTSHDAIVDQQSLSLTLQRVEKLVSLVRDGPSVLDQSISQTSQYSGVIDLCSLVISEDRFTTTIGAVALRILRSLTEDAGVDLSNDLIGLLTTQLALTYDRAEFQAALLDTIQSVISRGRKTSLGEQLIPVILEALHSPATDEQIDKWITLLCNVVPLLSPPYLMSNLLKITECVCKRIEKYFTILQDLYGTSDSSNPSTPDTLQPQAATAIHPERSISNLLAGLEYVLARAHQQASQSPDRMGGSTNASSVDLPSSRSIANDHLTVVLCIQDVLRTCAKLWLWRSAGRLTSNHTDVRALHHMSSKFRIKSRRLLENLIEAEPQECLETLMGLWVQSRVSDSQHGQVLELLQTLDGARPKFMMPATFNAIYSRTNPAALDKSQRSSLSINVNVFELIAFLNDYTDALEDDLLDEIWTDCSTFLKEILANPMPHRQILLKLLEFTAVLCRKMENTNFGEESRIRRELADLCTRLFTAIFTIKPGGLDGSGSKVTDADAVFGKTRTLTASQLSQGNVLQILHETLPDLSPILGQADRLVVVYIGIATHITGPLLRSKTFPSNISPELLALLQAISATPSATKAWRRDVQDSFNDPRFFQNAAQLVEIGWLPLVRQLVLADKAIMTDLLARLVPPAAAGLMFGVGAAAARAEADRKTQATLKRIALILLSMETDSFVPHLQQLLVKLEELLNATPESSPSSATREDVYTVLRAILLAYSQSQLASLWPLIDDELRELCNSMMNADVVKFTPPAKLQGAKLLDLLLLMKPDEFQLHEWLFVTDTVDAIYPSFELPPVALADQIGAMTVDTPLEAPKTLTPAATRRPWLCLEDSRDPDKIGVLLTRFFSHLSIRAFEDNYSLQKVDLKACRKDLIADLFVDG